MDIVRNDDGTLVVPVAPERVHEADTDGDADTDTEAEPAPTTRVLHPGEGGYDEALAEWDLQQDPDREAAVSTATGRQAAMALVHAVAASDDDDVAAPVAELADPEAPPRRCATSSWAASTASRTSPRRSRRPRAAIRSPPTRPPRSSARSSPSSTEPASAQVRAQPSAAPNSLPRHGGARDGSGGGRAVDAGRARPGGDHRQGDRPARRRRRPGSDAGGVPRVLRVALPDGRVGRAGLQLVPGV